MESTGKIAKGIYLKAAERVAAGKNSYSCNAIEDVMGYSLVGKKLANDYRDAMGFAETTGNFPDPFVRAITEVGDYESRYELRVLLLCMMAAAVGDL